MNLNIERISSARLHTEQANIEKPMLFLATSITELNKQAIKKACSKPTKQKPKEVTFYITTNNDDLYYYVCQTALEAFCERTDTKIASLSKIEFIRRTFSEFGHRTNKDAVSISAYAS